MTVLDIDISASISSVVPVVPTTEETDLREAVRSLLAAQDGIEQIRQLAELEPGYSVELWSLLADSMSINTIAVPESSGGLGYGVAYLSAVIEECGRELRPEPVLGSAAIGVPALLLGQDSTLEPMLSGALSGQLVVAASALSRNSDAIEAAPEADGWRLTGTAHNVPGGHLADILVVSAETSSGRGLFAVGSDSHLDRQRHESIDPTRPLTSISFSSTAAIALSLGTQTEAEITTLRNRAVIALAAENVGICDRLFEMTCEYTRSRKQFDRPIASFQAIKHRLADMLLSVERARSAALYAAAHFDYDPSTAHLAAATAGAVCAEAAQHIAAESIQLHGGIGFTWEHPVHSYYRRVLTNESLYGDATSHRREIARHLGLAKNSDLT